MGLTGVAGISMLVWKSDASPCHWTGRFNVYMHHSASISSLESLDPRSLRKSWVHHRPVKSSLRTVKTVGMRASSASHHPKHCFVHGSVNFQMPANETRQLGHLRRQKRCECSKRQLLRGVDLFQLRQTLYERSQYAKHS